MQADPVSVGVGNPRHPAHARLDRLDQDLDLAFAAGGDGSRNIVDGEGNLTDGIRVNASNTAQILDGTISGNTSSNNTQRGIAVVVNGGAGVEQLVVDGNILSENLLGGFLYDANVVAAPPTPKVGSGVPSGRSTVNNGRLTGSLTFVVDR